MKAFKGFGFGVAASALVLSGLVGLAPYPAGAALAKGGEVKIGTVNMQEAIQSSEEGKKARTELETAFNKKKGELQKEEADIKKMHEELDKQSLVMNEAALSKKQQEIQQRILKFQESTARSQMEIQKKEQELTAPIVEKLRGVVAQVAKDKGYTIVLEKSENNVLLSPDQDDLTKEVVEAYNKAKK
ncbi:MAG TPA: OmpH family outer membrane protein [Bdellovibrionota bacterium]|jgi:outer membrane protein|nr:OmpH family outer membrane protein [Bdellovibrionota bacterium]